MEAIKRNAKLTWLMGLLVCAAFCASAPKAAADSSYGVNYSCDGVSPGTPTVGQSSASFTCAQASGSVNMISGASSVEASGGGSAAVAWYMTGTVGGTNGTTGTLTVFDSNITGGVAGGVSIGIADLAIPSDSSSACETIASSDCGVPFGAPLSTSLSVQAGEQVTLFFNMACGTNIYDPLSTCNVSDPVTLALSPGLTFDTTLPDFLSGSTPPSPTPEPSSLLLFGIGLLSFSCFVWRGRFGSQKV